jgi:hypothetical protein
MTKTPSVPKENRSPKGPGEKTRTVADEKPLERDDRAQNPDQQGQAANTKQNVTHQGHQQDR